ncbi:MAG TPA: DUF4260 domain-containing protein [Rhizomicrobium sp.]|nr:DUF4260 domain-containing protein [Rhizomicrobium sp.]
MGMEQDNGQTQGPVRALLRLEGLALLGASLFFYARMHASWLTFAEFFLAPDLIFAAYLFGPRLGAVGYNAVHSTIGPLILGSIALMANQPLPLAAALIWLAHIGFDRALGFGLKYPDAFGHTHLGGGRIKIRS